MVNLLCILLWLKKNWGEKELFQTLFNYFTWSFASYFKIWWRILIVQLLWKTSFRKRKSLLGIFHLMNCKNVAWTMAWPLQSKNTSKYIASRQPSPEPLSQKENPHSDVLFGDLLMSWGLGTLRKWWFCPKKHNFLFCLQPVLLTVQITAPANLAHSTLNRKLR